jgi:hypothetical protein
MNPLPGTGHADVEIAPTTSRELNVSPYGSNVTTRKTRGEKAQLDLYTRRLLWFATPLLIIFIAMEWLLWSSGETWPITKVIQAQRLHPQTIFMRLKLDQGFYRYKYLSILQHRPQIIALGSSRVMQFRSEMFGSQAPLFYNAGGMIRNVYDLDSFIDTLPKNANPKTIILGVDMWWLNARADLVDEERFSRSIEFDGTYEWKAHFKVVRDLTMNYSLLKAQLRKSIGVEASSHHIGLSEYSNGGGFRRDGSTSYGIMSSKINKEFNYGYDKKKLNLASIRQGVGHFRFTTKLSKRHLADLRAALVKLKKRSVFVIGFTPPLTNESATVMQSMPEQRSLWLEYKKNVPQLFEELGFPCVDASTPSVLGLDDRYMRDGYHGMETLHVKLLQ